MAERLEIEGIFDMIDPMNEKQAIAALGALSQETRLAIFRLLVEQGPAGLPAGQIGERLAVTPPTLSFHLKELDSSGLLNSRRESRQIIYSVDFSRMQALLNFLTEDCCKGLVGECVSVEFGAN